MDHFILIGKKLTTPQEDRLNQLDLTFQSVNTLTFTYEYDQGTVSKILDKTQAIWVFPSKRAVVALKDQLSQLENRKPTKIMTVGIQAANMLNDLGLQVDLVARTSEEIVAALNPTEQHPTVINFHGKHYRPLIAEHCRSVGIAHHSIECYQAHPSDVKVDLSTYSSYWIFSPLGAKSLAQNKTCDLSTPVYSIGPITTHACEVHGFTDIRTSNEPTFDGLVDSYLLIEF